MAGSTSEAPLVELLRELAIAWRALSSYPPGHPSAAAALGRAVERFGALLGATGPLDLLAGRRTLIRGDQELSGPNAERFAELLRRRNAAAVRFEPGVEAAELETFLRGLLVDPRKARAAGSLAQELTAAGVGHILIRDLDFSSLAVVEGEEAPLLPEAGGLWELLVRQLVAGGQLPAERLAAWIAGGRRAVELLAALLGRAPGLGADDAAWTGRALEALIDRAAGAFAGAPGVDGATVVAAIHAALVPELRLRLEVAVGRALRDHDDPTEALDRLAVALGPEAMVRIRGACDEAIAGREAAGAGEEESEQPPAPAYDLASLQRLRRLFSGTDLDAVDPEVDLDAGAEVLQEIATGPAAAPAASAHARRLAERLSGAALERALGGALLELSERPELPAAVLAGVVGRLEGVYSRLLEAGDVRRCYVLVERCARRAEAGGEGAPAFEDLLRRLARVESVAPLVAALERLPEEAAETVERLLRRLGAGAVESLLDLLAESDDRATRHRLLGLLAGLGTGVVEAASVRLNDPRWYVVRNMLVLLRRLGDPGSVPAVRRCVDHPDIRVRLEAIRNLFGFDQELPRELLRRAFSDPDPRLVEAAIDLAGSRGIVEAVDPLLALLQPRDLLGRRRAQRVLALRALGELAQPRALDGLRRYVARFQWLPVAAEERRELFRTLARYPEEARRPFVERGLKMRDPEVRRIAAGLARAAGGAT